MWGSEIRRGGLWVCTIAYSLPVGPCHTLLKEHRNTSYGIMTSWYHSWYSCVPSGCDFFQRIDGFMNMKISVQSFVALKWPICVSVAKKWFLLTFWQIYITKWLDTIWRSVVSYLFGINLPSGGCIHRTNNCPLQIYKRQKFAKYLQQFAKMRTNVYTWNRNFYMNNELVINTGGRKNLADKVGICVCMLHPIRSRTQDDIYGAWNIVLSCPSS